jgi:uncharacterized membrane protein YbhN (UPF0104 family)
MPETKARKSKRIFLFLRIIVVAAGITWAAVWLSKDQRWENLVAVFRRLNLGLFALSLAIFIVGQLLIVFRWRLLLRTQAVSIEYLAAVRLHFLGLFYNNFMPGAVGGDLLRAWYVTKHTDKRFHAALSVFVDRVVGFLSSIIIAVFFYTLFLPAQDIQGIFSESGNSAGAFADYKRFVLWASLVVVAVFCGLLLCRRGRVLLKNALSLIRVWGRKVYEKSKDAVVLYCGKPLAILSVFALTVFLQLLTITGFWLLGANMGITAGLKYYYVFFPLGWAFGAMPVSIGGAVVVEGLMAYLFIHFAGVGAELALALALCQRIIWMVASLPGAIIHLVGAHLPKDFSIDYNGPIN